MDDDLVLRLALALHSNPGTYAILVGSGLSSAGGIPTGWDIVRDLARRLAAMEHEEPNPDPESWYARKYGEAPNYSHLLDRLAGTAAERTSLLRSYFEPTEEEQEQGLKTPTQAHRAIAVLVRLGCIRMIVTTNFDRLLETALEAEGIVPDIISTDDNLVGATPYVFSRCTIVKVNGDYKDTRIKNTAQELEQYSPAMNALLDRVFDDFGLVICGWSGVWDVALRNALLRSPNRRYSAFWLSRGGLTDEAKQVVQQRRGDVIPIESADQLFTSLLEKVQALQDMTIRDPMPTKVAVSTVKRHLVAPEHRIRLHDLVTQEIDRVNAQLTDKRFDPDGRPAPNEASMAQRMHQYETSVERLLAMLASIAYHDKGQNSFLITRAMEGLLQPKPQAGYSVWLELQFYPALLACYAAGIAALCSRNYRALAATLLHPRMRESKYGGKVPAILRINGRQVFAHSHDFIPRPNAKNEFTPANEYLLDALWAVISDFLPDKMKYEETFDTFEYLLGLTCLHFDEKSYPPVGAFSWRYKSAIMGDQPWENCVVGEYITSEIKDGLSSGLLTAGFFNSDEARLKTVVNLYLNHLSQIARRRY